MHPLRKHILGQLIINNSLPFSKLKPRNTESNIFMYHLKQLINEELVKKQTSGEYCLTEEGQAFADKLSFTSLKPVTPPKAIMIVVCKNKKGEYLLYKRMGHPMRGLIGFPFFDVVIGEKILDTAKEKLNLQFGLTGDLTLRGSLYFTTFQNQKLTSYVICHILQIKNMTGEFNPDTKRWDSFWKKIDQIDQRLLLPGSLNIHRLINKKQSELFFEEHIFHI